MSEKPDHWLVRPKTIRALWIGGSIVLALTVLAQLFVKMKETFVIEAWFAFAAIFGFFSCAAMILVAKGLGLFVKRKDTYYDD